MTNQDRSAEKPVQEWVTGDEPMTGPQRSYLETLAREAGREIPDQLTKAEASELIERLQHETGRGAPSDESAAQGNAPVEELIEEGIVDQQSSAVIEPDR